MAELTKFSKVHVPRVADVVLEDLKKYLISNRIRPGTKLPRERDLAEQLGVSRLTLREALRALETMGVIQVRRGGKGGVFCGNGVVDSVSESLMFVLDLEMYPPSDVMEMRLIVEPQAAALAAKRHNAQDFEKLLGSIEQMAGNVHDDKKYLEYGEANKAFHIAVAEASHNLVIAMMITTVGRIIFRNSDILRSMREVRLDTLHQHREVLEAISERDTVRASSAMRDHLKLALDVTQAYEAVPSILE